MQFLFDVRDSDSPFVERIWRTESTGGGSFISAAETHWEMVVTKQMGGISFNVHGPETKATTALIPEQGEFLGIIFKLGAFMPHLPTSNLVNGALSLPLASERSFWLHGSAWQFPDYENADSFVERLVSGGLLLRDAQVESVLQGQSQDVSLRSVQRRFLKSTGLTYTAIRQIERAQKAKSLLEQGFSILDAVDEAGYYDQPHLTRSLKHFLGQTPAKIG